MFKRRFLFYMGIIIILAVLYKYFGLSRYFNLTYINEQKHILAAMVGDHYVLSVFIFIGIFIFASFMSIPITIILNVLAGFLFGTLAGALYVNIGTTVGSTLSFLMTRYFWGAYVQYKYGNKLKEFNKHIEQYGYSYLLFLQLLPATPIFVINYLAGLASLSIWTFVWTTSVGILPGSLIYTFLGEHVGRIDAAKDILSWPIILALTLLALLAIIPVILSRFSFKKI